MRRGLLVPAVAAALLCGCAANEVVVQNPTTPESLSPSASGSGRTSPVGSGSPSATATGAPTAGSRASAATSGPRGPGSSTATAPASVAQAAELTFAQVAASTVVEQAVARSWRQYWVLRLSAYSSNVVEVEALRAVASGTALDQVVSDVSVNGAAGRHVVGRVVIGAPAMVVTSSRAEVTTCVTADARLVGDDGSTVEELPSRGAQISVLERSGTTWRVDRVSEGGDCP